jgi:hypothetical protein
MSPEQASPALLLYFAAWGKPTATAACWIARKSSRENYLRTLKSDDAHKGKLQDTMQTRILPGWQNSGSDYLL